jgi:hypothetical protein
MDGVEIISLYYGPNNNTITHQDGRIIYDLSNLISHVDLEFLKKVGGTQYINSDDGETVYEIVAPIPDEVEVLTFYYDKKHNVMMNTEGYVMFNIFAYIRPNDLYMFKKNKDDMRLYGRDGQIVELIYQDY